MVKQGTTFKKAKKYGLLLFCFICAVMLFKNELKLLFLPDPPVEKLYQHSFRDRPVPGADDISAHEGFTVGKQGLSLLPGSSGSITFSFDKEERQGCLLRVWFYGDTGSKRSNSIKLSLDGGRTFRQVTGSGNYIGSVFNLTPSVMGSRNFTLVFEAANGTPFSSAVLDRVEVMITRGPQAQPSLPNRALFFALLLAILIPVVFSRHVSRREKFLRVVFVLIIMLAAYLRWNEVVRVSGTHIAGDANGYLQYAQKMELFSDNGFYSAQFEKREPLYIFIVKLFFLVFGVSGTHLGFVSFVFSLVTVYLTYKIGKEWLNEIVGLIAASILAVHPYLIELSARGLRAEWFTAILLLFVYCGYVNCAMTSYWRAVSTGFLAGCILLTRSESLPMLVMLLLLYPLLAKTKWNYKMVLITFLLASVMWVPHLYSVYKVQGDPLYTANQYARFYANREFAGQPGFPTKEELATQGMYTGRKITPIEYYCSLHTPWQLVEYSIVGFAKIHLSMPFHFAAGKGTLSTVRYVFGELRAKIDGEQLLISSRQLMGILEKHFWDYALTAAILLSFLVGIVLIAFSPYRMLLLYMVFFQVQTSFVAYLGIDSRLTVHSYPLIALCCGCSLWWVSSVLRGRFKRAAVTTTVSNN